MNLLLPEVGQLVDVRYRRYVVTDVSGSTTPGAKSAHLISLSSVEDDAIGEELQVLWELELGARVYEKAALPEPTGFDDPARLKAFLNAVRWGAISQADDRSLQSPFRSGIDIEEYQLDPLVRALRMPRVNLLIADDVGLGKTIEAGLVIQEMILRHRIRSVFIVCPASIQIQWKNQMRDKFGLEFRIIDSEFMKEFRRKRGVRANPFSHFPRLITSVDYFKRERPFRLFRETLPAAGEPIYPRRYDLLIVDEAHNVSPEGGGNYATDSDRTQAVRDIAPHFEHKLFLTATPHNGYPESFSALLELVDNQRFARGIRADRKQLETVMVRRMKEELKIRPDGSRRFADREIATLEVSYSAEEKTAHKELREYSAAIRKKSKEGGGRLGTEFVLKLLKKRLFSSPAAFLTTLEKHIKSLSGGAKPAPSPALLRKKLREIDEDYADDELFEDAVNNAVGVATDTVEKLTKDQATLLEGLRRFGQKFEGRADSKAEKLISWLKEHIKPNGSWSNERVLIFTEYRTTQKWLQTLLSSSGLADQGRLLVMYGGMDDEERERIKAAFQDNPERSSVRILLATDAASEGIDLQAHCSKLIHYEIPWNPIRMEQRNGRLDRHGQKADKVLIHHFVPQGYADSKGARTVGELEGDLEFLMVAVKKIEMMREDLGKVGPVIAKQVEEAMLGQRTQLDTVRAEKEAEPIRKILKFERDLREQLQKLHDQLTETKQELQISPENVKQIVDIGLSLVGQPPLIDAKLEGIWPDKSGKRKTCPVFHLPGLTGSWAHCVDGLAHPHTGKMRPIVFDYKLADGRDDLVLAHLNHRLVQMCLRLLRSEIWTQGERKNLHRLTVQIVDDEQLSQPAAIAYGRIVVLGGDNRRLHEEIITAGGMVKEGRFSRFNVGETKAAAESVLDQVAAEKVQAWFSKEWAAFSDPLLKSLEARMIERTKGLQKSFDERVEREVSDITTVIQELEKNIRAELKQPPQPQLELWTPPEKEQLQLNLASLQRRLDEIPAEIERETESIKARYRNPTPRLFPVAVLCLMPKSMAQSLAGGKK